MAGSKSLQDIRQNHWTIKYRSQWPKFILRSNVVSYRLIILKYDVHAANSLQDIRQNHRIMKYKSQWPSIIFRSNVGSYWFIIPKYDVHISNSLQDKRQNLWTMKYRSLWPTFILRSNIMSYWLIIPKYDVHAANSLQDIRKNHWTMKYRSWWPSLHDPQVNVTRQTEVRLIICLSCFHNRKVEKHFFWPTFIFRSNIGSYWLIIPKYGIHISNSLQDIRQNHWTMIYRSLWPTFILRSNVESYCLIIPTYDVHTSNSLQHVRQNHWTVKYRSWWPSLHDPQVNVTRRNELIICLNCFHNRKVEKHFLKMS